MFALGPTPDEPMNIVEEEIPLPTIHLYNGKTSAQPWISKTTELGRVLVPIDEIPNRPGTPTPEYGGYLKADIPTMPQAVLNQALAFFRFALECNKSEAAVLIALDLDRNYYLYCPEQEVDYTGVDWKDNIQLEDDHFLIGSIHSHCDFSAFHSGTDESDAARNDGLHITIGHIDQELPEVDVMIAFSGVKWTKWDLATFLEGEAWSPPQPDWDGQYDLFPDEWINQLKVPTPKYISNWKPAKKKTNYGNWSPGYNESWVDDEWDDWEGYQNIRRSEKSTDERSFENYAHRGNINAYQRRNRENQWYSDDQGYAQDQILHDMKDLVLLAQEVGMTISFSVHQRQNEQTTLLPELTSESETPHADPAA